MHYFGAGPARVMKGDVPLAGTPCRAGRRCEVAPAGLTGAPRVADFIYTHSRENKVFRGQGGRASVVLIVGTNTQCVINNLRRSVGGGGLTAVTA